MNNFTKEYIKECDCEEIRWLQQDGFDIDGDKKRKLPIGNYYTDKNENIYITVDKERPPEGSGWWYIKLKNIRDNSDVTLEFPEYGNLIWLPLEGQLTEEILKRCYVYNLNLECFSEHYCKKPNCQKWGISIEADNHVVNREFNREVWNRDILIAKILLLKELLK